MLEIIGAVLFWIGFLGVLHTYVFYPLSLFLFARHSPPVPDEPTDWPKISLLIAAYNEETHIAAKIQNSLAFDYPPEKLEVLIGSDCSTDRTVEFIKTNPDPRIRLTEMQKRSGKTGVLNELVKKAQGDILFFTDANTFIDKTAARKIVRHFGDPDVGAVCGRNDMIPPAGAPEVRGENYYRRFETFLKTLESNLGGMTGAFGAFYAIRRDLFHPFLCDGSNDDIVILLHALKQGKRVIFEPAARSFEETGASLGEEFRRRIRTGAANFQTLAVTGHMIQARYGATAYTFFSHKVLRWVCPFLLLFVLAGSLLLQGILFYKIVLWVQIIGYSLGFLAGLGNLIGVHLPGLILIYHFTILNVAFLLGFFGWIRGSRQVIWERTERSPL